VVWGVAAGIMAATITLVLTAALWLMLPAVARGRQ